MPKSKKKSKRVKRQRRVPLSCYFTDIGTKPNYKEVLTLRRFISDRSKVLPQKYTGVTSKNQRLLSREVKKARFMALLPYTDRHAI